MPKYATSGGGTLALNPVLPACLFPGDEVYLFGTSFVAANGPTPGQIQAANDANVLFEVVALGDRSIAVSLVPRPAGGPPGVMVQVVASADPGASEIDVQDAAIDADAAYITPTGSASYKITVWTAAGNGQFTGWAELQPEGGRFVSLKCIANPNGVKFTAKLVYV